MPFDFGQNWLEFSANALNEEKVNAARKEFQSLTGSENLLGKSFVDIGFGQGLSLMIAAEMGAYAIGCDINPKCKETLERNRSAFFNNISENKIQIVLGSILDENVVDKIRNLSQGNAGSFDIVHSWGVLHHTGKMNEAIKNAASLVKSGGLFYLALYNKHWSSPVWKLIKRIYCNSPPFIKKGMILLFYPIIYAAKFIVTGKNPKKQYRGMDFYYDVIDWVGGYPYEYISINKMKKIMNSLGFSCIKVIPASVPTGCNEFVFEKNKV